MNSQFSVLIKKSPSIQSPSESYQHMPVASILEILPDERSYLWPVKRTVLGASILDPNDPGDQEVLYTGHFIMDGGFYTSPIDYMKCNDLPVELFYVFDLGEFVDVEEARNALNLLKAFI